MLKSIITATKLELNSHNTNPIKRILLFCFSMKKGNRYNKITAISCQKFPSSRNYIPVVDISNVRPSASRSSWETWPERLFCRLLGTLCCCCCCCVRAPTIARNSCRMNSEVLALPKTTGDNVINEWIVDKLYLSWISVAFSFYFLYYWIWF